MVIEALSAPETLLIWVGLMIVSQIVLLRDLAVRNSRLMSLMKAVWMLTVPCSGPLGPGVC